MDAANSPATSFDFERPVVTTLFSRGEYLNCRVSLNQPSCTPMDSRESGLSAIRCGDEHRFEDSPQPRFEFEMYTSCHQAATPTMRTRRPLQ
jgi:hypothetical protein